MRLRTADTSVAAENRHCAEGRACQAGQVAQQGRFAGSIRPQNHIAFAAMKLDRDFAQRCEGAVELRHVAQFDGIGGRHSWSIRNA